MVNPELEALYQKHRQLSIELQAGPNKAKEEEQLQIRIKIRKLEKEEHHE